MDINLSIHPAVYHSGHNRRMAGRIGGMSRSAVAALKLCVDSIGNLTIYSQQMGCP